MVQLLGQQLRYSIHAGSEIVEARQEWAHIKAYIELLNYLPVPVCDVAKVNASGIGERGLLRGHIPCFDFFGQPGTWQDAACLLGIEKLIYAAHDDPAWVHELLGILQRRKLAYIDTLQGARYDVLDVGS